MIDHALVGSMYNDLSQKYSVCLATQSSLEKLHSIVQVAHHWTGPISAALFAAGDEEYRLLQGCITFYTVESLIYIFIPLTLWL
jgi:N-acetyllactosaminide beta-1,3-N-acetylglucosaminyltransferase